MNRRALVGALLSLGGLAVAGRAWAAAAPIPESRRIAFDIRRAGDSIGRHELRFHHDGRRLAVDIDIEIAVSFAFIPVFAYRHRNREVWQDGRLLALDSETDDDGQPYSVTARAVPEGLRVSGSEGALLAPADIMPTSYWNPLTVSQTLLLDSQHGRLLEVRPQFHGEESLDGALARRYRLAGDLNVDLWYSAAGEWLKTAFEARGAAVNYSRRPLGSGGRASD